MLALARSSGRRLPRSCRLASSSADVVVAGGGLVGTAAAVAVARLAGLQNHKVVLLESSARQDLKPGPQFSNRVAALSPATVRLLQRLGAWSGIQGVRAQPVYRMQVWDSCSDACITFGSEEGEDGPLNYLVENDLVVHALTKVADSCPNLEVRYGAKVSSYSLPSDSCQTPAPLVTISLEGGDCLDTSLLLGADGFGSLVRRSLTGDQHYMGWQYDQTGLVATLTLAPSSSPNTTAFQRFLPSGPLALLPLGPATSSLVWTVGKQEAPALLALSEESFTEAVNTALESSAGEQGPALALTRLLGLSCPRPRPPTVTGVRGRAAFPLGFGHSPRYVGPRVALVGDSAHRVHPLAGQGANLGFGDVAEIAEQVQAMVLDGAGLGHSDYLRRYETARQRHNVPTMLGIDGIQKLYSTSLPPLVLARTLGLSLTAACGPLRRELQARAAA